MFSSTEAEVKRHIKRMKKTHTEVQHNDTLPEQEVIYHEEREREETITKGGYTLAHTQAVIRNRTHKSMAWCSN